MKKIFLVLLGILLGVSITIISKPYFKKYNNSKKRDFKSTIDHKYVLSGGPQYKSDPVSKEEIYKEYKDKTGKKPTLKFKVINWDQNTRPENVRHWVHEVLSEKYALEYSDTDYNILLTGFYKFDKVPLQQDNVVSIYSTAEAFVGDSNQYTDDVDLVMGFDFIEKPNYIRVPLYYLYYKDKISHNYNKPEPCSPKKKPYFACFLVSNHGDWFTEISDGVYARDRLFHKLSLYKRVMSGGKHLNNIGGPVSYKKTDKWLSQCKFIISYENTLKYPGYVTEKPFQAYFAGGIPIYNTHKDSLNEINRNALLYAGDFADEDSFIEYIKKVDNDDDLYCKIWNERIITNPSQDFEVIKNKVSQKLDQLIEKKLNIRFNK